MYQLRPDLIIAMPRSGRKARYVLNSVPDFPNIFAQKCNPCWKYSEMRPVKSVSTQIKEYKPIPEEWHLVEEERTQQGDYKLQSKGL